MVLPIFLDWLITATSDVSSATGTLHYQVYIHGYSSRGPQWFFVRLGMSWTWHELNASTSILEHNRSTALPLLWHVAIMRTWANQHTLHTSLPLKPLSTSNEKKTATASLLAQEASSNGWAWRRLSFWIMYIASWLDLPCCCCTLWLLSSDSGS